MEDGETLKTPIVRFEKCEEVVRAVLGSIDKPAELNSRVIHAFSYYFDADADAGLIDYDSGNRNYKKLSILFRIGRTSQEDAKQEPNVPKILKQFLNCGCIVDSHRNLVVNSRHRFLLDMSSYQKQSSPPLVLKLQILKFSAARV